MNRKIYVTASDMMELRNQGYSNHDIAKMLDVSIATVGRYIGKQGKRMERQAAFVDNPKKEKYVQAPAKPVIPPYAPKVKKEIYSICDGYLEVCIGHDVGLIEIASESDKLYIDYDQARELVQFLAWASNKCKPTEWSVEDGSEDK